jgi:lysophospholipase L1-like esterase
VKRQEGYIGIAGRRAIAASAANASFDFTGGAVDARVLYTRDGSVDLGGGPTLNASYFNSAGTMVFAQRHMPRLDYDPNTHAALGLLIEPSVTNKMLQGVSMGSGSWGLSLMTAVANDATAPDGTMTANRLVCSNNVGATMVCQQSAAVTTGQVHEEIVIVKYNSGIQWVYLNLFDGSSHNAWFDIQNGVVGATDAGVTTTITALPNGWYTLRASWTPSGTPAYVSLRLASANSATTFTGDGVKSLWGWAGQLSQENTSMTDTLIPTPTVSPIAVTRGVEVAKIVLSSTAPLSFTFDDGSAQAVTPGASGLYTIPTNLNRRRIKRISGAGLQRATKKVAFHGDSITAGFLSAKPYWASVIEGCWTDHSVVAANYIRGFDGVGFVNTYGGNPNLVTDGTTVDAQIDSRYEMWLVVFAGTNDIWLAGQTAAQTFTAFQTYFNARVAAGWVAARIIVVTMLPRQATPANEASRITLNASWVSNQGSMGYKLALVDQDANIGLPGSQSNATYYNADLIHPKDAGHAVAAPYIEAQIFS